MRVVVVGSGIAGLVTALVASRRHEVLVVTKGALAESSTRAAQGGIAAVTASADSVALHVEDTLTAGAGLAVRDAVEVLCAGGPAAITALQEWGCASIAPAASSRAGSRVPTPVRGSCTPAAMRPAPLSRRRSCTRCAAPPSSCRRTRR